MIVTADAGGVSVSGVSCLDLQQTLFCGQCFRWRETPGGVFEGVAGNRVGRVSLSEGILRFHGADAAEFESFWRPYFDLDTDYAAIMALLSSHPALAAASQYASGVRVLRQDRWEALLSFIISQNNNIKRIGGIIARLCETFGDAIGETGEFSFPTPERLAPLAAEDLAPIRCGFRARYLIDAAQKVASGEVSLERAARLPLAGARAELMKITGVGVKVADCALLYGFHRLECFPVDVWIARAVRAFLPDGLPGRMLPYAGIAQQYLFHYVRCCPGALEQHS